MIRREREREIRAFSCSALAEKKFTDINECCDSENRLKLFIWPRKEYEKNKKEKKNKINKRNRRTDRCEWGFVWWRYIDKYSS